MFELLKNMKENDGFTLKGGKLIRYKTGWQVATEGVETVSPTRAYTAIQHYNGNCGVWYSGGVYYIDKSHRVKTKKQAMEIGRKHNQISVYGWARGNLAYCGEG